MTDASLEFQIQPSSGIPIYRQIMDQVRALAASERLRSGQMLPSIRQLATDLEVNMMTVSKAYARLEAEGIVERVRGTGMRVRPATTPGSVIDRQKELRPLADAMVTRAMQLNLTEQQIVAVVRTVLKERQTWLKRSSTSVS
ncbi:MAG TPA: GntR family transcriptional regulator [Pirellulales bacterium]